MNGIDLVRRFLTARGATKAESTLSAEVKAAIFSSRAAPRGLRPEEGKLALASIEKGLDARLRRYSRLLADAWRDVFRGTGGLAFHVRVAVANPVWGFNPRIRSEPIVDVLRRFAVETMVSGAVDAFQEVSRGRVALGATVLSAVTALDDGEGFFDEDVPGEAVPRPPGTGRTVALLDLAEFARRMGVDLDAATAKVAGRISLRQSDLDDFARTRTEEIRADVEAQIAKLRRDAQTMVTAARASGKKAAEVLRRDFADLEKRWVGLEKSLGVETSALADTIEASAYNEGRFRMYEASPKTAVIGYLYSAVLDSRTTPFCRAWDGYMAPRGHPVWKRVWPPNHWRCRSMAVAVLAGERTLAQLVAAAAEQPGIEPQRGFGGLKFVPPVPGLD